MVSLLISPASLLEFDQLMIVKVHHNKIIKVRIRSHLYGEIST